MKNFTALATDQVASLRFRDVHYYLLSRGWEQAEGQSIPSASIYVNPLFPELELLVPESRNLKDYAIRMAEVISALSQLDSKSPTQILSDMSRPPADLLRLRVASPETTLGTLPLEEGIRLLQGGRDLLLSSACSTTRPQAFHPDRSLKLATEFMSQCRLGQTERGSFVATIMAIVPAAFQETVLPLDDQSRELAEPFARRVTVRLMNSLGIVDDAVRGGRLEPILNSVEDGVSANLCEAIAGMHPSGEQSKLEIKMNWSRSRPLVSQRTPNQVEFAEQDFGVILEAAKRLRERAKPKRELFEGKVFSLQSEVATLFDDVGGKITMRTTINGIPSRIKVVLNRHDYRLACDAHRDEKRVSVVGIIHHDAKIRVYELSEPEDFRIIEDQS